MHTLIHDAQCSIAFAKPPAIDFLEYTLPLPAPDATWLASSASEWASNYKSSTLPSLHEVCHNPSMLESLEDFVDVPLTHMSILYSFWPQIWSYHNIRKLRLTVRKASYDGQQNFWYTSQYQELYRRLTSIRDLHASARTLFSSDLLLTVEHLMMLLQVSFLDLQQAAGRVGEQEAEEAFNLLQTGWYDSRESRCAVWHAGQVLRAASALRRTSLRDFYAIAVYQASLCLWVYGSIASVSLLPRRTMNGAYLGEDIDSGFQVHLDSKESAEKREFIEYGKGTPCVTIKRDSGNSIVPLTDLQCVMEAGRAVLRSSFPANCSMPPLVENLSSLMEELGKSHSDTGSSHN